MIEQSPNGATATAPPSPPGRLSQRDPQGGSATHTDNKLKLFPLERSYGDKELRLPPAGRTISLAVPIDALDDPWTPSLGKTANYRGDELTGKSHVEREARRFHRLDVYFGLARQRRWCATK